MPPRWFTIFRLLIALLPAFGGIGCQGTATSLPRTDLTTKTWFPPIVRQQGNSCSQQAGLYYLLTAERNRQLFLSSWSPANRLSPYQTYAILSDSINGNTHMTDGWHLAAETGVPLETDLPRAGRGLMHGFDKYVRALRNKPGDWKLLPLRTESDLDAVKAQLAAGHPLACDFQVRGAQITKLPEDSSLVRGWSRTGPGHTMIYAGYDDTIGYDVNGDGQITNHRDITGDGRVSLADHERGAFLVVNPWGPHWGTGGKAWALYREHAANPWPRAGEVATVRMAKAAAPRLMLKLSLSLQERRGLVLTVSDGARTVEPMPFRRGAVPFSSAAVSAWEVFGKVHRPGPQISPGTLANPAGGPLEMGFDLSSLRGSTISLNLASAGAPLQGTLHSAAVVELDSRGGIVRETQLHGLPVVLPPAGGTWTFSR